MNVTITTQALFFALVLANTLAFWLVWHRGSKKIAIAPAAVSILMLLFAIGESAAIQLFFGLVIVVILYGIYCWVRDIRHDSAQKASKTTNGGAK